MNIGSRKSRLALASLSFLFWIGTASAKDPFPVYKGLEDAVEFWVGVFTKYSRSQAIIHDAEQLSLVYDVVDLRGGSGRKGERIRWRNAKRARTRYAALLLRWSKKAPNVKKLPPKQRRIYRELRRKRRSFRRAARNVRAQQGLREKFRQGIARSGLYIQDMRRIFKKHGLPVDLTYLPHVESSFDYRAYSRLGAAGIWQFTRSTGRLFMKINYDMDERRDPIQATHAAAKLLRRNYQELGSWPLAITAYNHGRAGMARAVRQVGTKHLPTIIRKYRGRTFGFASRNFYAEFLAARRVSKRARRHFGPIQKQRPRRYETFRMPAYVSAQAIMGRDLLTFQELKNYNPGLRAPVLRGERHIPKGYLLRVPAGQLSRLRRHYASLPARLKQNAQKRIRWYRVRRGDSLGLIARRFKTTVQALAAVNDVRNISRIRAGKILSIPGGGKSVTTRHSPVSKSPRLWKSGKTPKGAGNDQKRIRWYRVRRGDSLGLIARRFKTTVQALAAANDVRNISRIRAGKILSIPGGGKSVTTRHSPVSKSPRLRESKETPKGTGTAESKDVEWPEGKGLPPIRVTGHSPRRGWTRVKAEETLGHFAEWLKTTPRVLRRLNRLRPGQAIQVGQRLLLSFHRATRKEFENRRLGYHKSLEEDFHERYRVIGTFHHTIQEGESLWELSHQKYEVPFWLVARYNPELFRSKVAVGGEVTFPKLVPKGKKP